MKKSIFIFSLIIITIFALATRISFINVLSGDMRDFVLVWMQELEDNGGIRALGLEIGNYNISYMSLLAILTYIPIPKIISAKMLSIIFDFIIATTAAIIAKKFKEDIEEKRIIFLVTYSIILLIPTLILNSSAWGQCDAIYFAFILISILYLIKEKYIFSLIMLAISLCFKLQAIFILPLYGLIYLGKKKFPFYYFFIIPIINFLSWFPAIINGRSIVSCFNIYLGQTETVNNLLTRNFVNIYNFIFNSNSTFIVYNGNTINLLGIFCLIAIFIIISIIVYIKKIDIRGELIFLLGMWSVLISTFLLPYMHERYIFIADILSVLYCIIYRKKFFMAIAINFISLYLYLIYLKGAYLLSIPPYFVALVFLITVIYLNIEIILNLVKKEEKELI